ncbi:hypothetical protein [Embleya sp. AB8]|uniref:hypothetical protein n=1 Tax=Embleya sp. AB8 TaxID=3156304 RepID=UPI003C71B914
MATWWQAGRHLLGAWRSLAASDNWSPDTTRAVLADAAACARALADLHRAGVRHGDLRPERLVCGLGGRAAAMIVGWASGAFTRRSASGLVAPAYTGGCPLYAAPEVGRALVEGRVPERSEAADVWALAESIRVALGGRPLRIGSGERPWEVVAAGHPRPFAAGTARRLPELAALLARALDPDPRARPSADEIACLLQDAVSHRARAERGEATTRSWHTRVRWAPLRWAV